MLWCYVIYVLEQIENVETMGDTFLYYSMGLTLLVYRETAHVREHCVLKHAICGSYYI